MKSSPNQVPKIIRDAPIQGITFCGPGSREAQLQVVAEDSKQEDLKALEEYWYQKGLEEGETKGFERGLQEGETKGFDKGSEAVREVATKEGFEEGRKAAIEQVEQERLTEERAAIDTLERITEGIQKLRDTALEEMKPEILHLTASVCKKILKHELESPEMLPRLLGELLVRARPLFTEDPVSILLSQEDHLALEGHLDKIEYDRAELKHLRILKDEVLVPGQIIVSTSSGMLNFDIDRQVQEIYEQAVSVVSDPNH